jgi:hypothetical protein
MDRWSQVETVSLGDETLIRCRLCGKVLERVSLMEKLLDSEFARRVYKSARAHGSACRNAQNPEIGKPGNSLG